MIFRIILQLHIHGKVVQNLCVRTITEFLLENVFLILLDSRLYCHGDYLLRIISFTFYNLFYFSNK